MAPAMPSREVEIPADHQTPLAGLQDGEGARGVVLCSHFTGFKELTHLTRLSRELDEAGLAGLRFDYHDCIGASGGACEDMRVTHQVRDTLAAVRFLRGQGVDRVGLWGHSLGGLTALAAAAEDRGVRALVTVAAPVRPAWDEVFADRADEWAEQGYVTFPTWKRGEVRIDHGFYQDLKRYDAEALARDVEAPVLVVQPGEDELVDPADAGAIHDAAPEGAELFVVEGADHLLSDRAHEEATIDRSVGWFDRHL